MEIEQLEITLTIIFLNQTDVQLMPTVKISDFYAS